MMGITWRSSRGSQLVVELLRLFPEASSRDHYLQEIAGDSRHCHGYGLLGVISRRSGVQLLWEKFDAADILGVDEESCKANLDALASATSRLNTLVSDSDAGLLILHSRRASRGEPRGTVHAHPFLHVNAGRHGYRVVAVAHNGGLDKRPLATLLGVDPEEYTDTGVLAAWLARQLGYGLPVKKVLDDARQYVRTALNVLVAEYVGNKARLHIYTYLKEGMSRERIEYYRPYVFEKDDVAGYISSTIADLAAKEGLDLGRVDSSLEQYHVLELEFRSNA